MDKEIAKKIGDCWSDQTLQKKPPKIAWWESSIIIQHINQLVCGEPVDGFSKGLMKHLKVIRNLLLSFFGNGIFLLQNLDIRVGNYLNSYL